MGTDDKKNIESWILTKWLIMLPDQQQPWYRNEIKAGLYLPRNRISILRVDKAKNI